MISTIIAAVIGGLIIGALARLAMPGSQNISILMTIVLGILGSAIGSWIAYMVGYNNSNGGFAFIPFILGIIVAAILIAVYLNITKGRSRI